MATSVKGVTQKLPQEFKIDETYRDDHSLESSWGALGEAFSDFFSKNLSLVS
jgi:hypothetical protein